MNHIEAYMSGKDKKPSDSIKPSEKPPGHKKPLQKGGVKGYSIDELLGRDSKRTLNSPGGPRAK